MDVGSIFIVEDFGSSEFPNANGTFDCLNTAINNTYYKAVGNPIPTALTPGGAESSNQISHQSSSSTPVIRQITG